MVQLYFAFKKELAPFSPVLKFLAVKVRASVLAPNEDAALTLHSSQLVIFAMFWQETLFAGLETFGVIKDKEYWTAGSIVVGLAALCACFEMVCFCAY